MDDCEFREDGICKNEDICAGEECVFQDNEEECPVSYLFGNY